MTPDGSDMFLAHLSFIFPIPLPPQYRHSGATNHNPSFFFHNCSLFTPTTLFKRHPTSVGIPVAPVIYDTQVTFKEKVFGIGTFV